jgi:hypothetical protein
MYRTIGDHLQEIGSSMIDHRASWRCVYVALLVARRSSFVVFRVAIERLGEYRIVGVSRVASEE